MRTTSLGPTFGRSRRWRAVAHSGEVNDALAAKALSVWQDCRQLRTELAVSQELLSESTEVRLAKRAFLGIRRRKKVEESKQAMNRDDVDVTVQRR